MRNLLLLFLYCLAPVILSAQFFQLTVENGYGSGLYTTGDTVHIWSKEWDALSTFSHWSGDTLFLEEPGEWHTQIVMPMHDVMVKAHIQVLPTGSADYFTFEQIMGKNILKPVHYYFPANGTPDAVVWLWHGTGGSAQNWVMKDFEMRQFCNYLVANNMAIIVTESDESTLNTDLDGDGNLRYNYSPDTINNWDVANVRAIRDTFIHRGMIGWSTSMAAGGFSAGGSFSIALASLLNWVAAICHNAPGPAFYVQITKTPILYVMSQRDAHIDVGQAGNLEAFNNTQFLLNKGQCSKFYMLPPSPVYHERFMRIPGISKTQSTELRNELLDNDCLDAEGFLTKSPNQIEALVVANPGNWPVALALTPIFRDYVIDELAVMWASHHFAHDFMDKDIAYIRQQCMVTSLEDSAGSELQVFPNPGREIIYLPLSYGRAQVFNVQGIPVLEKQLNGNEEMDVSHLPLGLYFIEIFGGGKRSVMKWVKI